MLQVSIALTDEPDTLPSFIIAIIEATAKGGEGSGGKDGIDGKDSLSAANLAAQILVAFDELAARLISAELELISIQQLDVPPPPASPPPCQMPLLSPMQLSQDTAAGSQVLKVEAMACGLEVAMLLSVGEQQPTREEGIISGFGSILLSAPLQYGHAAGEVVVVLASSPPMAPVAHAPSHVRDDGASVLDDGAGDQAWLVPLIICGIFLCFALVCCGCCWCRTRSGGKPVVIRAAAQSAVDEPADRTYPVVTPRNVAPAEASARDHRWSTIALDRLAAVSGSFTDVLWAEKSQRAGFADLDKAVPPPPGSRRRTTVGGGHSPGGHSPDGASTELTSTVEE